MTTFTPVTRRKSKLRLALTGVSGAGKTLGALYIAYGITGDWGGKYAHLQLIVGDTENGK